MMVYIVHRVLSWYCIYCFIAGSNCVYISVIYVDAMLVGGINDALTKNFRMKDLGLANYYFSPNIGTRKVFLEDFTGLVVKKCLLF